MLDATRRLADATGIAFDTARRPASAQRTPRIHESRGINHLAVQWRDLRRLAAEFSQSMVVRVKTTVDIAEPMLKEAKLIAAREGTTLRALVEEGLRHVIEERDKDTTGFRLRDASFTGDGGMPGIDVNDWMSIKHLARGAGS